MNAAAIQAAWRALLRPGERRFHAALDRPGEVQREHLRRLVHRHRSSAFARAHGFDHLGSATSFTRAVPVRGWEAIAPWIGRLSGDGRGVVTTDPVLRLLPTSGSAVRKLIPWTAASTAELGAALAPWLGDLARRHPGAVAGRSWWSATPPPEQAEDQGGIPIGFTSDAEHLGGWAARLAAETMAVPAAVAAPGTPVAEALHRTRLHLLRAPDLTLISIWHPSFLAVILDGMRTDREQLLDDLARGVPAAGLAPDPVRSRALAAGRLDDPHRLWPRLALVSAWADGPAAVSARALAERIHPVPVQGKGLLATEGVTTIPVLGSTPLAVTSHVHEFRGEDGRMRWADELAPGSEHEVVLTTGSGLWRYATGDRVRVVGRIGRTPCLRFLGRIGTVHDLAGEKLDESVAATALAAAVPSGTAFAALQPDPAARCWRLVVDCDADADAATAAAVDRALHRAHHWRLARDLGQLAAPRLVRSRRSAAELLITLATRRGIRVGDLKPPALLPADAPVDADGGAATIPPCVASS